MEIPKLPTAPKDMHNTDIDMTMNRSSHEEYRKDTQNELVDTASTPTDTQSIRMNNERVTIPEILFNPPDIGIQQKGIAEALVDCIKECPSDARFALLDNVVLTGGNTLFPNFADRLFCEIQKYFDHNYNFLVHATPE